GVARRTDASHITTLWERGVLTALLCDEKSASLGSSFAEGWEWRHILRRHRLTELEQETLLGGAVQTAIEWLGAHGAPQERRARAARRPQGLAALAGDQRPEAAVGSRRFRCGDIPRRTGRIVRTLVRTSAGRGSRHGRARAFAQHLWWDCRRYRSMAWAVT